MNKYNLVADIGGTNARFALVEIGHTVPISAKTLNCKNYFSVIDAIKDYLKFATQITIIDAVLAVAAPINSNKFNMTNNTWEFCIEEIRLQFGFNRLQIINDFSALALAVPYISNSQITQIGIATASNNSTKAIIGAGTGLGVSASIFMGDNWHPLESEGGHISYCGMSDDEIQIINVFKQNGIDVSAEIFLSGSGVSRIYSALSQITTGKKQEISANIITQNALNNSCSLAVKTLEIFCQILGNVASNLALTLGARGGVYIGGGIALKIVDFLIDSNFRNRFETEGRFANYLKRIPTYVITSKYLALIGAAIALDKNYKNLGISDYK